MVSEIRMRSAPRCFVRLCNKSLRILHFRNSCGEYLKEDGYRTPWGGKQSSHQTLHHSPRFRFPQKFVSSKGQHTPGKLLAAEISAQRDAFWGRSVSAFRTGLVRQSNLVFLVVTKASRSSTIVPKCKDKTLWRFFPERMINKLWYKAYNPNDTNKYTFNSDIIQSPNLQNLPHRPKQAARRVFQPQHVFEQQRADDETTSFVTVGAADNQLSNFLWGFANF